MKLVIAGAAAFALLATAGCDQNMQPSNRVLTGAVVGTTVGALGGLLVGGNDRRNALVGAGIGLLVGAGVGKYLDEQEKQLQTDLRGTGATVTRDGDRLLVSLPEAITFDTGSWQLMQDSRRAINQLSRSLNQYPSSYIDVVGHTDSVGDDASNQVLSERRATSVQRALIARNVAAARIQTAGYGERQPIASNDSADGRARNRRVEVYIYPAT